MNNQGMVNISGRIYGIYYTLTRQKKEMMAVIHLERLKGAYKAVILPKVFKRVSKYLKLGACVQVEGIKDVSEARQIIAQGNIKKIKER